MSFLLPSNISREQTCSQCRNYLTYLPIKLFFKNSMVLAKCGRCHRDNDVGTESIYNKISKHLLFPCINEYEGCNQLMHLDDVPQHEEKCIGEYHYCPLCPPGKRRLRSLLYLIHHYKTCHQNSILTKPVIYLQVDSYFENYYLYYDNIDKILVIIFVTFHNAMIQLNVSTTGNRIGHLKYHIVLGFENQVICSSEPRSCSSLNNNFETFVFQVYNKQIGNSPSIWCEIKFDTSQIINFLSVPFEKPSRYKFQGVIEKYGTPFGPKFEDVMLVRKFPKVELPKNNYWIELREKNGVAYLKSIFIYPVHFFCDFCENYCFFEKKSILSCQNCQKRTCVFCQEKTGIRLCMFCNQEVYPYNPFNIRSRIMYYCKHGCEHFFMGNELEFHENRCYLNENCSLDRREIGFKYFEEYFYDYLENMETFLIYENVMEVKPNLLKDKGIIYMITDTFHCLITYEIINGRYRFKVAHKYLPNKFFILIRAVQLKEITENSNNFSLSALHTGYFVILLKEKESHKKKDPIKRLKRFAIDMVLNIGCLAGTFLFFIYFYNNISPNFCKLNHLFNYLWRSDSNGNSIAESTRNINVQQSTKPNVKRRSMSHIFFASLGIVLYYLKHIDKILL